MTAASQGAGGAGPGGGHDGGQDAGLAPERLDAEHAAAIEGALAALGLPYENPTPGAYLVKLEGQHKLATMTWLIAARHSLHVEAFFCRKPDENLEGFYRFLLERNGRTYGVHFAIDQIGDVYLVGRLPLAAVTEAEIDRILGCVLSYSDENFDTALELGFASAIRREWAWRAKNGESLANLQAFARFADPEVARRRAEARESRRSLPAREPRWRPGDQPVQRRIPRDRGQRIEPAQRTQAAGLGEWPVLSAGTGRGLRRQCRTGPASPGPQAWASGRCTAITTAGRRGGILGGRPPGSHSARTPRMRPR